MRYVGLWPECGGESNEGSATQEFAAQMDLCSVRVVTCVCQVQLWKIVPLAFVASRYASLWPAEVYMRQVKLQDAVVHCTARYVYMSW
jgi:hypothetical protein